MPIVENIPRKDFFYGFDGLTGLSETDYKAEIDTIKEKSLDSNNNQPHGALKILELVNKYPNEVTILAMGPLTNLALALHMSNDPDGFTKKIKKSDRNNQVSAIRPKG